MAIHNVDPRTVKQWLDHDEAVIIDVREPAEHASQSISGSVLIPLGTICKTRLPDTKGRKLVLHCQAGMRGSGACKKLLDEDPALDIYHLEGGLAEWQKAGLPLTSSGRSHLPLDRQVQLIIGLCVLLASILAYTVSPAFLFVTGFFGVGLTIAGLTGFCGLALMIAKAPWNQ